MSYSQPDSFFGPASGVVMECQDEPKGGSGGVQAVWDGLPWW